MRGGEGIVTDGNKLLRELTGLGAAFWALFLLLSLGTYHPDDPSFNQAVSHAVSIHNGAGLLGSFLGGLLVDIFGLLAFVWPIFFLQQSIRVFTGRLALPWWRWTGAGLTCLWLMTWLSHPAAKLYVGVGEVAGGGFLGDLSYGWSVFLLSPAGAFLFWTFVLVVAGQLIMATTWGMAAAQAGAALAQAWERLRQGRERRQAAPGRPRTRRADDQGTGLGGWRRFFKRPFKKGQDLQTRSDAPIGDGPPPGEPAVVGLGDGPLIVGHEEQGRETRPASRRAKTARRADAALARATAQAELAPDDEDGFADEIAGLSPVAQAEEPFRTDAEAADLTVDQDEDLPFELVESAMVDDAMEIVQPTPRPAPPRPNSPFAPEELPPDKAQAVAMAARAFDYPPLDFLAPPPLQSSRVDAQALKAQALRLEECLRDFSIQGEVQRVTPGPVVTMFEYKPAPGVKISRIAGLADDLTLALKALAVRIEAPIPGKDAVGVEIPNPVRETVWLREILESEEFQSSKSKLTLALGKDIAGQPRVADLARMPHLLVAGATGAGKSVCLNGILLSLLYKASPDEVKLLLIDPKRIELSVYSQLPHLVHPVVTDMSLAKNALDWAVYEMDKRYEAMARLGVRNIDGYNQKLESMGRERHPDLADLAHMPFLVLIIDELADLMLTAAKEVETSIVRLAQLARAAGIHLILATQRPSVDVVTGLIKANFPTRVSFQVTSKHDSRTILDTVGAEHLLGRGDMLFKPSGGKLQRMHGAYVSEEEIAQAVEFWRVKRPPQFELDFTAWAGEAKNGAGGEGEGEDLSADPMYLEAVDFVSSQGKASISLLQRRFRIGFNKAARLIEQMERDGLLGPQEGAKPRAVLRGRE